MECLFEHQWHENERNKLKIAGLVVFCTKDSMAVLNVTKVAECACKVSLRAQFNINMEVLGKMRNSQKQGIFGTCVQNALDFHVPIRW